MSREKSLKKRQLLNPLEGLENPQRRSLNGHPQIVLSLAGIQRALGETVMDPQLLTEPEEKVPHLHNLWKGGSKEQPVV